MNGSFKCNSIRNAATSSYRCTVGGRTDPTEMELIVDKLHLSANLHHANTITQVLSFAVAERAKSGHKMVAFDIDSTESATRALFPFAPHPLMKVTGSLVRSQPANCLDTPNTLSASGSSDHSMLNAAVSELVNAPGQNLASLQKAAGRNI
jgi:hypothetical protein